MRCFTYDLHVYWYEGYDHFGLWNYVPQGLYSKHGNEFWLYQECFEWFFFPTPTPYLFLFFFNKIYTYCSSSRYINGYVGCMCALSCVKIASNTFHSFIESKKYLVLGFWVSIEPTNLMKLTRLDVLVCWIGLNCNFILRFELDRVQMNSLSNPYD